MSASIHPNYNTILALPEFHLEGYLNVSPNFIGSGGYGKIYSIKSLKLNKQVAVKQINMSKIREQKQLNSLVQEIQVMKQIKCENIVEYIDSQIGPKYSYILTQLCESDLRKQMNRKKGKIGQTQSIQVLTQISHSLQFLLKKSYIHRDLKPDNILLKKQQNSHKTIYKLTDFGYTIKADLTYTEHLSQFCGTPIYMAPQLLLQQPYTAKCDIWSLGLMMYQMIYGSTPQPVKCLKNYKIVVRKRPLAFPYDVKIKKETKDFIKRALQVEQKNRMSWKEVFEHPLLARGTIENKTNLYANVQIPFKIRKVLSQMQRQAHRKYINILQTFQKYSHLKVLTYKEFSSLLKQLNPTISTHEIYLLFTTYDKDNSLTISREQFHEMFCHVDYHENPEIQNQIQQIVGIICAKQIQIKNLFQKYDTDHSGVLNWDEFKNMLLEIAPFYSQEMMKLVFERLDKNGNKKIQKREFLSVIGQGLVTQKGYIGLQIEKVIRNIKTLKQHLRQHKLNSDKTMKIADFNKDDYLDYKQFQKFLQILDFKITQQQIFELVDGDKSGKLSLAELQNYFD